MQRGRKRTETVLVGDRSSGLKEPSDAVLDILVKCRSPVIAERIEKIIRYIDDDHEQRHIENKIPCMEHPVIGLESRNGSEKEGTHLIHLMTADANYIAAAPTCSSINHLSSSYIPESGTTAQTSELRR